MKKLSDSELVAALRRESAGDRAEAPPAFDFAVMRAVRDTAPALVFPARRERAGFIPAAAIAACLMFGVLLGARTMGRQLESLHAAGATLADVAESAGRLARSVRPPSLPEVPRLSTLSPS